MQKYKYTYQDWLDGKIKAEDLRSLVLKEELDEDWYEIIREEQDEAYLKLLSDAFELKKRHFLNRYAACLVKQDYLNITLIGNIEVYKKGTLEQEEIVSNAIHGIIESKNMTAHEVELCLSSDINKVEEEDEYDELIADIMLLRDDFAVFRYIVYSNFLEWLYWFRDQQKLNIVEPTINQFAKLDNTEKQVKKQISYTWLSNPDTELPELYQRLIDAKLIHHDTTKEQFKAVFTAQPLKQIQPIKWHDANASELLYFIMQLEGIDEMYPDGWLIGKESRADYKRLTACFVKPDGAPFPTKNLKQSKNNVAKYGISKDGSEKIDSIINHFY